MSTPLDEIDRILELGDDPDDALRAVVASLVRQPGIAWAGILFLENGALVLGPEAGAPEPAHRIEVPVLYQGAVVGALAVDGEADAAGLERVAALISTHVLLGWDTRGEAWEP